jgi:hypothetical protein
MGKSPNPRWLVKFDGQPYKDEEMYEHAFGRLLKSVDDEDGGASSSSTGSSGRRRQSVSPSRQYESKKSEGSSDDDDNVVLEEKGVEPVLEDHMPQSFEESNAGSESEADGPGMSQAAKDRVSAREARSKRRQAKIDVDVYPAELPVPEKGTLQLNGALKNKRHRGDDEGDVIQVKLLTGTLYLYRGKHRRAEFIRRV